MTPELQDKLYADFPELFVEKDWPVTQSCMSFGCEIFDGWEPIVRGACEELAAMGIEGLHIVQVKEKFGGLRIYLNQYPDGALEITTAAEDESYKVCEVCGEPGTLESKGWWNTRCAECRERDKG
jgi:hypothetical protein